MISVIIPAYNAQNFISDAINSVLAQSNPNWELIIVDDGSTDDTFKIITEFSQKDERIKIFSQPNSGPSAARKKGVEKAHADWITFLDSDDLLLKDAINIFYESLEKSSSQIHIFSIPGWFYRDVDLNKEDFIQATLYQEYNTAPWSKLYKRSLFNNHIFDIDNDIRSGEDWIMLLRLAFKLNDKISLSSAEVYEYRNFANPESLMKAYVFPDNYNEIYFSEILKSIPEDKIDQYYNFLIKFLSSTYHHKWRKTWKLPPHAKQSFIYNSLLYFQELSGLVPPKLEYLEEKFDNPFIRFLLDFAERGIGITKRHLFKKKNKYYCKK